MPFIKPYSEIKAPLSLLLLRLPQLLLLLPTIGHCAIYLTRLPLARLMFQWTRQYFTLFQSIPLDRAAAAAAAAALSYFF